MPTQINPQKLLLSKWTAIAPKNREKHFLVIKLLRDELDQVTGCVIEAALSHRAEEIDWRLLKDESCWRQGWL